jgi:hypothetical protein
MPRRGDVERAVISTVAGQFNVPSLTISRTTRLVEDRGAQRDDLVEVYARLFLRFASPVGVRVHHGSSPPATVGDLIDQFDTGAGGAGVPARLKPPKPNGGSAV